MRPPYRGMRALEAGDAGIFFGRAGPIVEVLDKLRGLRNAAAPRLLVILGASGSGESSFLRAGLLPRLARDDRHFRCLPAVRPERAALTGESGLMAALEQALLDAGSRVSRGDLRHAIEGGAGTLKPLLARLADPVTQTATAPTLILPVDQAEVLFHAEGQAEAHQPLSLISGLAAADNPAVAVVFTIRSDRYERLQTAEALAGLGQQTYSLHPLPKGVYGQVITGSAQRLTGTDRVLDIEDALTEACCAIWKRAVPRTHCRFWPLPLNGCTADIATTGT